MLELHRHESANIVTELTPVAPKYGEVSRFPLFQVSSVLKYQGLCSKNTTTRVNGKSVLVSEPRIDKNVRRSGWQWRNRKIVFTCHRSNCPTPMLLSCDVVCAKSLGSSNTVVWCTLFYGTRLFQLANALLLDSTSA